MAASLGIKSSQNSIYGILDEAGLNCLVLIDRLDEGYHSDDLGIGIVNGILQGTIDLNLKLTNVKQTTFVRDNIFRRIIDLDQDFSRNIEGQEIRLHWNEKTLFEFVAKRIAIALKMDQIKNGDLLWNRIVSHELQGTDGFKRCLQYTLYRPRDLLSLLNKAYYSATKDGRDYINSSDLDESARSISQIRYSDLIKEYDNIIPGIQAYTKAFSDISPEITAENAVKVIESKIYTDKNSPAVEIDAALHRSPETILRVLYSVGFIGIKEADSDLYVYCHDGKTQIKDINPASRLLVHPCYWMSLGLNKGGVALEGAEVINDEYEIKVSPISRDIRAAEIGRLIAQLGTIEEGVDGASDFEDWCLSALRILFAGHLRDIRKKPNLQATHRRDIVGTNMCETSLSQRIYDDYGSRHVIFEVKNYRDVKLDDYRQISSYLTREYGLCGFIICRAQDENLRRGIDLEHFRVLYNEEKKMIIKLHALGLANLLSKQRSPQKGAASIEAYFTKILDKYFTMYAAGQAPKGK